MVPWSSRKTSRKRPWASTQPVRPLLEQRTRGRPFSTARNTAEAACCHWAALSPNQPLLVRLTRKSVSSSAASRGVAPSRSEAVFYVAEHGRGRVLPLGGTVAEPTVVGEVDQEVGVVVSGFARGCSIQIGSRFLRRGTRPRPRAATGRHCRRTNRCW